VSADGHAHALDLLPEFDLTEGARSGIRFPWLGTEFTQYAGNPSAPGPGTSGPGSFYTRPDRLGIGVLGPTTAITFSDAPDRIEWAGRAYAQEPNGRVQPAYARSLPAGGAYAQAWAISTADSVDGAEALAGDAEERLAAPAGPDPDPAPSPTPAPGPGGSGATPPPVTTPAAACRVPRLRGLRLTPASAALSAAHCRLGAVKRRRIAARVNGRRIRRGRVARQSLAAGTLRPAGTAVNVTLQTRRPRAPAATAAAGPSVRADSRLVSRGDRYALSGRGWAAGDGCASRIRISQTFGHGVPVGSARIGDDGSFTFRSRIRRDTKAGTRLRFDATQFCDGVGTTRSATVRVGRAPHGCAGPLSVAGDAYALRVWAGLTCSSGAAAIGPFLDTHIDPDGFACAHVDPATGHDAVCTKETNPASRVTARRLSEV
jgi:hypothetical protein